VDPAAESMACEPSADGVLELGLARGASLYGVSSPVLSIRKPALYAGGAGDEVGVDDAGAAARPP
jgi:hypothetical protein